MIAIQRQENWMAVKIALPQNLDAVEDIVNNISKIAEQFKEVEVEFHPQLGGLNSIL